MRLLLLFLIPLLSACTEQADNFEEWYEAQGKELSGNSDPQAPVHVDSFHSAPLRLDTIYRSMQGPDEEPTVRVGEEGDGLIWLTGYSARILDAKNGSSLSEGYMCHNNLNLAGPDVLPWKIPTQGTRKRLFILTEGQVRFDLPEGTGIPVPAGTPLSLVSQVLNHNEPDIDKEVRHEVHVRYKKESELETPLIPLYQQPVFVTKRTGEPEGPYGAPIQGSDRAPSSDTDTIEKDEGKPGCALVMSEGDYNPYKDPYGRRFTGHWDLPDTAQTLRTDVTPMLNLSHDATLHAVGIHMHPFAKSLELRDKSADTILFTAEVQNKEERIGIRDLGQFQSRRGIRLKADHRYELISRYAAPDTSGEHTAMAVASLYLSNLNSK